MYEKIDRLREDLARARKRKSEADARVKACEARLKEAENNQILAEVGALKLTPEQVANLLKAASEAEDITVGVGRYTAPANKTINSTPVTEQDYDESEDFEDDEK